MYNGRYLQILLCHYAHTIRFCGYRKFLIEYIKIIVFKYYPRADHHGRLLFNINTSDSKIKFSKFRKIIPH